MQVQGEDGIEFLDLKLKLKNIKIAVNVFAKPLAVILEKITWYSITFEKYL